MLRTEQDKEEIIAAATKHVRGFTEVPNFRVTVDRLEVAHARFQVNDLDNKVQPLYGFAGKKDGKWYVLAAGTFFEPEFYQQHGIGKALRL